MNHTKRFLSLLLAIILSLNSFVVFADTGNGLEDVLENHAKNEEIKAVSIPEGLTKVYLDGRTGKDSNSGKTTDAGVKTFAKAAEIVDGLNGDAIISITSPVLVDNEEWNVGGETKYLQVDETFGTTTMTIKNKITGDNIPDANTIFKYKVLKEVDGNYIPLVGEYTVDGKNSELNDLKKLENGIFEMKRDSIVKLINLEIGNYKFILLNENDVYNNHINSFLFRKDRPNPENVEKDINTSEVIFSTDLSHGYYDQNLLFAHNYDYETSNDSGTIVINMFEIGYKLFEDEEVGIKLSKYGGGLGAVSYRINDGPIQSGIPQNGILEVKIKNRDVLRFIDLEEDEYIIEEVVEAYNNYAYYVTFSDPTNYIKSKSIRIDLKSGSDNYFGAAFVNNYNGGGSPYTTFDEVIKVENSLTMNNIVFDGKSLDKNPNYLGLDNIILAEKEIIFNNSAIQRFNRNIQSAVVQLKNGSLVLDNTTVTDNYTNTKGVIYIDNEEIEESLISNITNSTFTNNTNLTNDINSEIGNVIHLLSASINISESNFENNQTNKKAVIFIESGYYNDIRKESTINETSISNNNGTGLEVHKHNDVILKDSNINGNIRAQGSENAVNAAGLIVADSAKVTMNGGSISNNKNIPMEGEKYFSKLAGGVGIAGASYGYEPATFIMNSGSISENIGSHGGGVSIAGDVLMPSRRIGLFYGEQSLTNGIFTMNSGEVSGNKAIGLPYAISSDYPPLDESVGLPGEGGGIYFGDGMVKISGDSNIKDNTAIWQFKDENFAKTLPVSMSFPRGNGIFVKNMSSVLNGNGLYLSGSPKINSNNDVFLNGDLRDNGVVQSFIQADDTFIGEGEGGENQIQITTPINYIKDYSNENKYILSTRPNVEPAEKADVKVMGTPLVYYSKQELAKAAEDAKYFKASNYMSKDNGYDDEKYPEYKDGFNIYQSKFENAESYLTFGGSSVKPISSLEISKTLAGDKQPDPDSIFEFDIVIVDPENWDSTPLEGEYKVGEDIRQIEEGKISIKAGETAIIENLSSSEKFIITEIYYPEDNYGGTTIKVDDDIDHTIGQNIGVETVAGKATKLEFFNYYYDSSQELHSLKLQKTVEGNKELEDEKFEFTLKYKYPYEDEYLLVNGFYKLEGNDEEFEIKDGKISLSHNDGLATLKLVDEYGYRLYVYKLLITETKPIQEGYRNTDISVKNTDKELNDSLEVEVDVVEHGDPTFILPEVTFINNYGEEPVEPDKSSIKLSKRTTGTSDAKDAEFEFTVTGPENYSKTVILEDNGDEILTDLVVGEYTITETEPTSTDYKDTSIAGGDKTTGLVTKVTIEKGTESEVIFTNNYKDTPVEPDKSSIKLSKRTTGTSTSKDEDFEFTITGPENYSKTVKLKDNGDEALTDLVVGEYTITETEPKSEDYLGTDITGGTETTGLVTKVTIEKGTESEVIFTNNYKDTPVEQDKSSIKLTKRTTGTSTDKDEDFEFTITGPENYSKTVKLKDNGDEILTDLVVGEYTITETEPKSEDYLGTDITGGTETTGLVTKVTIEKGKESEVIFTNNYSDITVEPSRYNVSISIGETGDLRPVDGVYNYELEKIEVKPINTILEDNTSSRESILNIGLLTAEELVNQNELKDESLNEEAENEVNSTEVEDPSEEMSNEEAVEDMLFNDEEEVQTIPQQLNQNTFSLVENFSLNANGIKEFNLENGRYRVTQASPSYAHYIDTDISINGSLNRDELVVEFIVDNGEIDIIYTNNYENAKPTEPEKPIIPIWPLWPDPDPVKPMPELNKEDHYAYMIGYPDKNFMPSGNITRAEAVTIFFRMLTDDSRNRFWSTTNEFNDVKSTDWYNNALSTMANANVIEADRDGNYRPEEAMTRADFAILLTKFFDESGTSSHSLTDISGHYAEAAIAKVAQKGWIEGYPDGTFKPDAHISRAETAKLVNRILERTPHIDGLLEYMIEFPDVVKSEWYYAEVQEATNSHEYERESKAFENWTRLLPVRDWAALEKEWSNANSSKNPGDVQKKKK